MTARVTGASPATRTTPARGTTPATGAAGSPGLLVSVLSYLTVVIAAFAPLAAGIYLLTSLAWSLAERMLYSRSAVAATDSARQQAPHGEKARGGRRVQKA
jgi:YidC/Oxa1 family membrane protein insertase